MIQFSYMEKQTKNTGYETDDSEQTQETEMNEIYTQEQLNEAVKNQIRVLINKINTEVERFAISKDMEPDKVRVDDLDDLVMFATEGCKQRIRHYAYNDRKSDKQKKIKEVLSRTDIDLDSLKELRALLNK
jgi:hypothetical protein